MTGTLEMIAAAMHADADAVRTVGINIANSDSVAYRRQIPVARLDFAELSSANQTQLSQSVHTDVSVDQHPGELKSTGEPMNLAIEGNGFFVLSTSAGEVLTRRGDFKLNADGILVDALGHQVLGESGPISVGKGGFRVDVDGTIRSGSDVVDKLRIAQVSNPSDLVINDDGSIRVADGAQLVESGGARVRQGFLESSNVQPVTEMLQLMETMRAFETAQRFAHGYDDMLDKAITQLGKV
jgi:flagellar basal-body rod protein FlgF